MVIKPAITVNIPLFRYPHADDLPVPAYQTPGAAGFDLYAAIDQPLALGPGERVLVSTGVAIALPAGYEAQIRPRSGLALKCGLTVLNSPGTVDSDYRGEIKVLLINLGTKPIIIQRGDRVAQCIIGVAIHACWKEVAQLPPSSRANGGFGHTGHK
ncbi:MAG TPA: dUTP diphosphatase [bacterium]|jgi:dUTP pyrophosphatase|nr:dUTP diphosphatase [bacterium]